MKTLKFVKQTMVTLSLLAIGLLFIPANVRSQNNHVKKVVFQAFWWDYWNNNFQNSWANYLTELAPRLKSFGIDAVWIPPSYKNGGTNSVGYSPFDHYDLGDKYQKPESYWTNLGRPTNTRVGTKDELLRMIAVMHANGIEVIQDIVLNHVDNAGSGTGSGGQDPETSYSTVTNGGYKNFRYVSYANPLGNETSLDYWSRDGRWSKNYQNFHPNPNHNSTNDAMTESYWGPDICYGGDCPVHTNTPYSINGNCPVSGGVGQSSNVIGYNPAQPGNYMKNQARDWMMWLKKQTNVDGFRWDAVKHFDIHTQQDLSWNVRYLLPDFAKGGEGMISVGEYVGNKDELDAYSDHIYQANGGNKFIMGTFDFGFRAFNGGLKSMIDGNGFFNMADLAGAQQNWRYTDIDNTRYHRTMPFVNNHDTYRPQVDASGNITGWNNGQELSPHFDPGNSRLALAYAAIMAIDGNPQIFFEDLFNIYGTGKRYSHLPTSETDLPVNEGIKKLIWAHQVLDFKGGSYKIRTNAGGNPYFPGGSSANDLLAIERSGKAVIGLNDNGGSWQSVWVDTDFNPGTVIKDYSGANGTATYTVNNDKRINVNTPPVDPANGYYGYSIWAPVGFDASTFTPARTAVTTQEWEMANDLGDSHCLSLGYGGALPANKTNQRIAGKIYAEQGKNVEYKIYPEVNGLNLTGSIINADGEELAVQSGVASNTSPLTINYTPAVTGWLTIKVRNTTNAQAGQKVWCNVAYTAPKVINTRVTADNPKIKVSIWTGNKNSDVLDCSNWEEAKMPDANTDVIIPGYAFPMPVFNTATSVKNIRLMEGAAITVNAPLTVHGNFVNNNGIVYGSDYIIMGGSVPQSITGITGFGSLEINNNQGVSLNDSITVSNNLKLTAGNLKTNSKSLLIGSTAGITGGSAGSYLQLTNASEANAFVYTTVGNTLKTLPVGNATYTPLSLNTSINSQVFKIKCFENVYYGGTYGPEYSGNDNVNVTWYIKPTTAQQVNAQLQFQWNASDEHAGFNRSQPYVYHRSSESESYWEQVGAAASAGSNPYTATLNNVDEFSTFMLANQQTVLPVQIISFNVLEQVSQNILQWKIPDIANLKYFEVEKSTDGIKFQKISTVNKMPNIYQYNFTDKDITAANTYYRIMQVNADMTSKYSPVQQIRKLGERAIYFDILPNPTSGLTNIKTNIPLNEKVAYTLSSADGKVLLSRNSVLNTALTDVQKLIGEIADGVYYITIKAGKETISKKVVKAR